MKTRPKESQAELDYEKKAIVVEGRENKSVWDAYGFEDDFFRWIAIEHEKWSAKPVKNVASLIDFLEWLSSDEPETEANEKETENREDEIEPIPLIYDKENLESQLDNLYHDLQENQSELSWLSWRWEQIEQEKVFVKDVKAMKKEISEKKVQRKKRITELQEKIKVREDKIRQLGFEVCQRAPVNGEANNENLYIALSKLRAEKKELQKDLFSFQEKIRLDSKEIERLNAKITKIELENELLHEQLELAQNQAISLEDKIKFKAEKLERLKSTIESKLESSYHKAFLETLLISQKQVIRLGNNSQLVDLNERQMERAKSKLKEKLSEEEIQKILQVQVELTSLNIELEKRQEEIFEARTEVSPEGNSIKI
ncbi:hypothetical protein [endosymbiont GvMRE of Glomus versiforme]|uniref:hypothetical protein n=1 Tax=endosymbiont GvMRE of Glomus versiforme TaxID=2039283 RepID=UPI0011C46906|nr:hypothetical protein [endosymbiont GvMRE of Glomus versiforme]